MTSELSNAKGLDGAPVPAPEAAALLSAAPKLPELVGCDWTTRLTTSSSTVTSQAEPTALVQLQIREQPTRVGEDPQVRDVNVELGRRELRTLMKSLHDIRDMLDETAEQQG